MHSRPQYTLTEELFSSVTHGIGAALSVVGLVVLLFLAAQRDDAWRIISFSIYGGSLILLYLCESALNFDPPSSSNNDPLGVTTFAFIINS